MIKTTVTQPTSKHTKPPPPHTLSANQIMTLYSWFLFRNKISNRKYQWHVPLKEMSIEADALPQDCFASVDWNMFREPADSVDEITTSVTGFIRKCIALRATAHRAVAGNLWLRLRT
jgi:hypothetical protein